MYQGPPQSQSHFPQISHDNLNDFELDCKGKKVVTRYKLSWKSIAYIIPSTTWAIGLGLSN